MVEGMSTWGDMLVITVTAPPGVDDFDAECERLGLAPDEVDADFGLVPIDPERDLYVRRVTASAALRGAGMPDVEGPFSAPRIEDYGAPRSYARPHGVAPVATQHRSRTAGPARAGRLLTRRRRLRRGRRPGPLDPRYPATPGRGRR